MFRFHELMKVRTIKSNEASAQTLEMFARRATYAMVVFGAFRYTDRIVTIH